MEQIQAYIVLFGIIIIIGHIFNKSTIPITLLLVITGMLLSFIPKFPQVTLKPDVVLNIFLPLLIYQISSFSSWAELKKYSRPIALLSVGHVIFITILVAVIIHALIPGLGWPLAFLLGAVISPPDDVAIVSIAEKVHMPRKVVAILEGEGMFNDVTALTLFKFALLAVITHQFFAGYAVLTLFMIIIGESLFGLILGIVLGELRIRICNTKLHIIASVLTPFLAYFPAEMLGGSGILATAVTGFVIGERYAVRFTPEYRLVAFAMWPALAFILQNVLFLWVGLDIQSIIESVLTLSYSDLALYSGAIIATVIIGRFLWVYIAVYFLPRFLFPSIRKQDPFPPWQYPFIISWAGMRGSISLAAALAVPALPVLVVGTDPRNLIIFLVFTVIAATFILQGLTLPWLLKVMGINKDGKREEYKDQLTELAARKFMVKAVLRWLLEYKIKAKDDPKQLAEVKLHIQEYRMHKSKLLERIKDHKENFFISEKMGVQNKESLLLQIMEVERTELLRLWHTQRINITIRNKLLERLDHRSKHIID